MQGEGAEGQPSQSAVLSRRISVQGRWIVFAVALTLFAAHLLWFRDHIVDDAFITFRYARHLADGSGAVFNRGEAVEGYTNFLWMLSLAGADALGLDLPRTAVILGGLCSLGTLLLVVLLPWPGISGEARSAAGALLAANGSFVLWGKSGLEVGLYSLWLTLACWLFLREPGHERAALRRDALLSSVLGLAALTRPEGIVLFALMIVVRLARRGGPPARRDLGLALPGLTLLAGQAVFRLASYGTLLPNTYHAKVGWSWEDLGMGLGYLAEFMFAYGPLLTVALLGLLLFTPRHRTRLLLGLVIGAYTAAIVWEGGDSFPLLRFFAPLMPFVCLLAAQALQALPARGAAWRRVAALGGLCLVSAVPSFHGSQNDRIAHDTWDVENWTELGRHLSSTLGPEDSIALNPVGAVGYECRQTIIDMLGINDAVIARSAPVPGPSGHRRANGPYVLGRRPTLILIGWNHPLPEGQEQPRLEPAYASDMQLLALPELRQDYKPVVLQAATHRFTALRRNAPPASGG